MSYDFKVIAVSIIGFTMPLVSIAVAILCKSYFESSARNPNAKISFQDLIITITFVELPILFSAGLAFVILFT